MSMLRPTASIALLLPPEFPPYMTDGTHCTLDCASSWAIPIAVSFLMVAASRGVRPARTSAWLAAALASPSALTLRAFCCAVFAASSATSYSCCACVTALALISSCFHYASSAFCLPCSATRIVRWMASSDLVLAVTTARFAAFCASICCCVALSYLMSVIDTRLHTTPY